MLEGKSVLIWGYGREGKSAEGCLKRVGGPKSIEVFEGKPDELEFGKYDVIIKSPGIRLDKEYPNVTSGTELFLEKYRDRVIGITGTKGKSTTSSLLYTVLSKCTDRPILLLGNIGNPAMDYYDAMTKDTIVVYEMSCHQLKDLSVAPKIAVFLNLYEEHLDYYDTMDNYFRAKSHIIANQKEGDVCYIGSNVPHIDTAAEVNIISPEKTGCYSLSIEGIHNQFNAEFVYRIASECFHIEDDKIREAMRCFTGLKHRLEFVDEIGDVRFFDDSISTIPEAAISAMGSLPDSKTLLIGGMDRGIDYGKLIDFIRNHNEYNYVCMYASGRRIYDSEGIADLSNVYYEEELAGAVNNAYEITDSGAVILSPAAASYGYFKNFEERGDKFASIVREIKNGN